MVSAATALDQAVTLLSGPGLQTKHQRDTAPTGHAPLARALPREQGFLPVKNERGREGSGMEGVLHVLSQCQRVMVTNKPSTDGNTFLN